ncbi:hypothetical protein PGAG_00256 [Phaeocystis globosa virus 12T]|uniref:Uncharacterized protein n=1 Tax=Phaeocystis globosa virus PgV-16T TaxID=3071227 RepID=A0AC59EXE1_9VIRU|nr:hypothetical protein PGCG_00295 [Phaeocystis globosa virus]AET73145.1 hypothetical protein PGAG_00256 [Phaeocystis globosa virus 12T]AET73969.1 hypothetical protein PGBG_00261 [Phaeocystis globosa virus 14T]AGM15606.1 hypothetical protein PGCG_00295 [Phaeocystis globosa virus PgV-16T]UYE94336.1 hypothetical protein PGV14T_00295 [Phaeocystis globosa virus]
MNGNCDNLSFTITQKGDIQNLSNEVIKDKFDVLAKQIKNEFVTKIKDKKIVTDKDTMKLLEDTTNNLAEKIEAEAKTTSYMALGPYLNLIFHLMENGDTDKKQLKNTITELGNLINNTPNSSPGALIDGIFSQAPPPLAAAVEEEALPGEAPGSTDIVPTGPEAVKATEDEPSTLIVKNEDETPETVPGFAQLTDESNSERVVDTDEMSIEKDIDDKAEAVDYFPRIDAGGVQIHPTDESGITKNTGALNRASTANAEARKKLATAAQSTPALLTAAEQAATEATDKAVTATAEEAAEKAKKDAVIKLQAGLRGNSSRNKTRKLKTETAAATKLQANTRRKSAQRKAADKKAEKKASIEKETASVSVSDLKKKYQPKTAQNFEPKTAQNDPSPPHPKRPPRSGDDRNLRQFPPSAGLKGKKTQKGGKKVDKKKTKRSGKMGGKNKTKRRTN